MSEEFNRVARGLRQLQERLQGIIDSKKVKPEPQPSRVVEDFTGVSWDKIRELRFLHDQKPRRDEQ